MFPQFESCSCRSAQLTERRRSETRFSKSFTAQSGRPGGAPFRSEIASGQQTVARLLGLGGGTPGINHLWRGLGDALVPLRSRRHRAKLSAERRERHKRRRPVKVTCPSRAIAAYESPPWPRAIPSDGKPASPRGSWTLQSFSRRGWHCTWWCFDLVPGRILVNGLNSLSRRSSREAGS